MTPAPTSFPNHQSGLSYHSLDPYNLCSWQSIIKLITKQQ